MDKYRERLKSVGDATTVPVHDVPRVVQPAPTARESIRPTRFHMPQSTLHETMPSSTETSVESEYRKYASSEVSSEGTDILLFWEVRLFQLNDAMT